MVRIVHIDFRNAFYALSIPDLISVINRRLQEDIQHILRLRDGMLSEDVYNEHLVPAHELTW